MYNRALEGKERDRVAERLFKEIITKNSTNLLKAINLYIQESQPNCKQDEFKGVCC